MTFDPQRLLRIRAKRWPIICPPPSACRLIEVGTSNWRAAAKACAPVRR